MSQWHAISGSRDTAPADRRWWLAVRVSQPELWTNSSDHLQYFIVGHHEVARDVILQPNRWKSCCFKMAFYRSWLFSERCFLTQRHLSLAPRTPASKSCRTFVSWTRGFQEDVAAQTVEQTLLQFREMCPNLSTLLTNCLLNQQLWLG